MHLSGETKFFAGIIVVTIAILIGAIFFFSKPTAQEQAVPADKLIPETAHATGSAQAKVTVVEFADYECPACGSAYSVVKQIVKNYGDRIYYVFRNFPLEQHTHAALAAEAAEAAGAQGKFWEMHDLLFENQTNLTQETINSLGIELGLDMKQFTDEVTANKYKNVIDKDITDGTVIGINSTPTFYLNGKKLNLFSWDQLQTEIDKALGEAGVTAEIASPTASVSATVEPTL